jgi:cytidine deaminase
MASKTSRMSLNKEFGEMVETVVDASQKKLYCDLLQAAREAFAFSYAPFSKFRVGAAVLMSDGTIYTGCNVENSNFAVGTCAERTAFAKAISEGKTEFKVVAVVCERSLGAWPCGFCRQFMREFGSDTLVVVEGEDGNVKCQTLNELLPNVFAN